MAPELIDWQVRYLNNYLFYVYEWDTVRRVLRRQQLVAIPGGKLTKTKYKVNMNKMKKNENMKRLICLVFLVCNIFICVIEYVPSNCFYWTFWGSC